jgi:hypothetical protein
LSISYKMRILLLSWKTRSDSDLEVVLPSLRHAFPSPFPLSLPFPLLPLLFLSAFSFWSFSPTLPFFFSPLTLHVSASCDVSLDFFGKLNPHLQFYFLLVFHVPQSVFWEYGILVIVDIPLQASDTLLLFFCYFKSALDSQETFSDHLLYLRCWVSKQYFGVTQGTSSLLDTLTANLTLFQNLVFI